MAADEVAQLLRKLQLLPSFESHNQQEVNHSLKNPAGTVIGGNISSATQQRVASSKQTNKQKKKGKILLKSQE